MTDREKHLKVLEKMFYSMEKLESGVILPTSEVKTALAFAISSIKTKIPVNLYVTEIKKHQSDFSDLAVIHTEGLDEEIRCTMCTNSMKSDRGCDGSCAVNNAMYKKVMDVIENHIADTDKMIEPTIKDCISRVEARKAILDHQYSDSFCEEHNIDHSINTGMALIALSDLPSVKPRKGEWLRMSDLSEQEDDRYKCSRCGNVIHHKNKMDLYTFNSWCGRCGSDNER